MKYLVVQTAFLGDIVLTTPLLRSILTVDPSAKIDFVTTPIGAKILEGLPQVRPIILDKKQVGFLESIRSIRARLRNDSVEEYTAVICVHRSVRSLLIAKFAVKARQRFAYKSALSKALGFQTIDYPEYTDGVQYVDKVQVLTAKALGSSGPLDRQPWLAVDEASRDAFLSRLSLQRRQYFVVSPYSVWGTKMWPEDRFAAVAEKLSKLLNMPAVITGDRAPINKIFSGASTGIIDLVGKTSVDELKMLISASALVLSNDSAAVHIASAFDIPTVAIFGPTVERFGFFPLASRSKVVGVEGLPCRPCHIHGPQTCPQKHFRCMMEITVDQVVGAARELI